MEGVTCSVVSNARNTTNNSNIRGNWRCKSAAAGSSKLSYTKIGRLVTVVGTIEIDNIDSGSGALQIGLPFTSKANDVGTGYHASYVGTYDVDILVLY